MPKPDLEAADPHAILGVRSNASPQSIRRAYHDLACIHHPDRNVGDVDAPRRFQAIHEAYARLTGKTVEPDNKENQAYGLIAQVFAMCFQQFLEVGRQPHTLDFLDCMRQALRSRIVSLDEALGKLAAVESAFAQMEGRFHGEARDAFEAMIAQQKGNIERQRKTPQAEKALVERALQILDNCRFSWDQASSQRSSSSPVVIVNGHR